MSRYYDISHFRAPYKAATLQGFGEPAVQLWYYDENPAGRVRCFVPAAAQVILQMIAGTNLALTGGNPVNPQFVVYALPQGQTVPGIDVAMLVALPAAVPPPAGAVPAMQWTTGHAGSAVALFVKTPGAPLDVTIDGLKAGAYGLMASSSAQMIAGEAQPLPSAVFAGYEPVLSKPVPGGGGGGGGGESTKAGIGPLGIATIAVVIGAIGYLALKKK